jgi:hypothetical protein
MPVRAWSGLNCPERELQSMGCLILNTPGEMKLPAIRKQLAG